MTRSDNTEIPSILSEKQYLACRLCPRQCGVDRTVKPESDRAQNTAVSGETPPHDNQSADRRQHGKQSAIRRQAGYCRCTDRVLVARAALHLWEEPCISGIHDCLPSAEEAIEPSSGRLQETPGIELPSDRPQEMSGIELPSGRPQVSQGGSGAVFFSGCTLGCCFCQNYAISHGRFGKEITVRELADIFLRLQDQGAYNINLVTATQYLPSVIKALELTRDRLTVPVVYNCGGYERPEIIRALSGYVDIWLPDLKYFDPSLAARCSQAGDYFTYASRAIPQMIAQTGVPVMDENGLLRSGVIVRHMVLPGARSDSIRLLHWMKENLPAGKWLLSLMSQYTPAGEAAPVSVAERRAGKSDTVRFPELTRRVTTFEYESVLNTAIDLGLTAGYMQQKSSAKEEYTPPFDLTGV